jgi:glucose-6-phosphate 1-epimerase
MSPIYLETLNDKFALPGRLTFRAGEGGLPVADVNNRHASAIVALHGGHVMAFQPHGHKPVLWLSRHSRYEPGQPIRGGIPVCWPWFGPHPTDPNLPAHGFARILSWEVLGREVLPDERTQLRLGLANSQQTQALWPHPFRLEMVVTVGPALQVDLVILNSGDKAFNYTGALHTYFSVSDVSHIQVHGLEDTAYIDTVDAWLQKVQAGPITITGETDRIYLNTGDDCVIEDPGWQRRIHISKAGSRSTVVWNPWVEKSRRLADFGDEEYTGMICVETANTAADVVMVMPAGEHRLSAVISVESLQA